LYELKVFLASVTGRLKKNVFKGFVNLTLQVNGSTIGIDALPNP
jgi:hypothetical protein